MLVYDITNEKSFDNIRNWIRNIEEVRLATAYMHRNCIHVLSSVPTPELPGSQMRSLRRRDPWKSLAKSPVAKDIPGMGTGSQAADPGDHTWAWPLHRVALRAHSSEGLLGLGSVLSHKRRGIQALDYHEHWVLSRKGRF